MTKQSSHVSVLVPAAGRGTRMGGRRKQYRQLGDESLLMRTLRLFDDHPRISTIVVAAPPADAEALQDEAASQGIRKVHAFVPGGANRQESVAAAFDAVPDAADVVLVHDAVRPFLPPDRIDAVIDAVESHGAAALAVPVRDTLRRRARNALCETVDRDGLYQMQTPQGFRTDWFREANAAARRDDVVATDDVALLERIGKDVRLIAGSSLNFKVTTPEDWLLARALWHHLAPTS